MPIAIRLIDSQERFRPGMQKNWSRYEKGTLPRKSEMGKHLNRLSTSLYKVDCIQNRFMKKLMTFMDIFSQQYFKILPETARLRDPHRIMQDAWDHQEK